MSTQARKRTLGTAALAAAVAAAIAGYSIQPQHALGEQPPRMMSEDIASVDRLANAMKEVGKAVEPSVVSINVEKQQVAGGGGRRGMPRMDDDMLRRFFPDNDGDGQPDVPPGLKFRFGQGNNGSGNNNDQSDDNEGGAAPNDAIPGPRVMGEGSGVILDATADKAYILTNNHVAGDAAKMTVTLSDGRKIDDVKLLGADPASDLAVLQINAAGLKAVRWGDSDTLDKGDIVLAFGSPFGYVGSMTQGIVSALNRSRVGILGNGGYENFIQTDCAINPGNSGGPLVNIHGEIVGINTAIASRTGGFNGVGFAIPSQLARFVYTQLKETGHVERGFLGVKIGDASELPRRQAAMLGLGENPTGAFVSVLQNGTPAAGKLRPNDVIVAIDGKKVTTQSDVRLKVSTMAPGTTVKLGVVRNGKPQDVEVTLGTLPDDGPKVAAAAKPREQATTPQIGATLSDANAARLKASGLPEGAKGALVTGVTNGSLAQRFGIENGDLITKIGDKDIASAADATAAIKDAKVKDGIAMMVTTKEGTKSVFVQADDQ